MPRFSVNRAPVPGALGTFDNAKRVTEIFGRDKNKEVGGKGTN